MLIPLYGANIEQLWTVFEQSLFLVLNQLGHP